MELETFEEIVRVLALIGFGARALGLLILGASASWFAVTLAFRKSADSWKIQIAALISFVALAYAVVRFQPEGALGAYALGAGGALFLWGFRRYEEYEYEYEEDDDEDEKKKK